MGLAGRDAVEVAGAKSNSLASGGEAELALQHDADVLLLVAVLGQLTPRNSSGRGVEQV